jgi:hypothetical protein
MLETALRFIFQFPNEPMALLEWFAASVALVVIVTLIYVFILSRSPPPDFPTVAKLESLRSSAGNQTFSQMDPYLALNEAQQAFQRSEFSRAVELSVEAIFGYLGAILRAQGNEPRDMSISDLAYLIQNKNPSLPQFAHSMYELNALRLRALQGQPVSRDEASWAISLANWTAQALYASQIRR